MNNLKPYTKEWLEKLCKESFSYRQVLEKAGRTQGGSTSNTLKKKIQEYQKISPNNTGHHRMVEIEAL